MNGFLFRPEKILLSVKCCDGTSRNFQVSTDFVDTIERNYNFEERLDGFNNVVNFIKAWQSQGHSSKVEHNYYLCQATHNAKNSSGHTFDKFLNLFIHVQRTHFPFGPQCCLCCGSNDLDLHFRVTSKKQLGGIGYLGACRVKIELSDPRK